MRSHYVLLSGRRNRPHCKSCPSVRPSVGVSVLYRLLNLKRKSVKNKIGVNVLQSKINRCTKSANFRLRESKVREWIAPTY